MKEFIKLGLAALLAVFIAASPEPASGQTNTTVKYFLTTFSPSVVGGLWIFTGDCPTNMSSMSGNPPIYKCADLRDSSMIEISNRFYVVFNDEQTNSCQIIVSPDMTNWSDYATIFVPKTFSTFWSPKFLTDTNGTIYLTAFVQSVADDNYYMGVGIMSSDLTSLNDFQVMYLSNNPASGATDPNSSAVYLHNGVYYLFTGDGNEYTATNILNNQWIWLTGGRAYGAGKSVAEWNGLFYMSATELGSHAWSVSADLTNWSNLFIPDALTPDLGSIGREGCFFTLTVPAAVPVNTVQLTIAKAGGNIVVSWPNLGSYVLEQSSNLLRQSWTTNSAPMVTANGTNSVNIAAPQGAMFFRLTQ